MWGSPRIAGLLARERHMLRHKILLGTNTKMDFTILVNNDGYTCLIEHGEGLHVDNSDAGHVVQSTLDDRLTKRIKSARMLSPISIVGTGQNLRSEKTKEAWLNPDCSWNDRETDHFDTAGEGNAMAKLSRVSVMAFGTSARLSSTSIEEFHITCL